MNEENNNNNNENKLGIKDKDDRLVESEATKKSETKEDINNNEIKEGIQTINESNKKDYKASKKINTDREGSEEKVDGEKVYVNKGLKTLGVVALIVCFIGVLFYVCNSVIGNISNESIVGSGEEMALPKDVYNELTEKLNYIKDRGYVKHQISETDFFTILYNSKGEGILNSMSGITLYTKDNNAIITGAEGEFNRITELTPLGYLQLCLDGVYDGLGKVTIQEVTNKLDVGTGNTLDKNVTLYTLTVEGSDNVSKLYKKVSDTFNTEAMEGYKEQGIDVSIIMEIYIDDENGVGGIYKIKLNDDIYTVWMFDGYAKVGNWELPETLYEDEISVEEYDNIFHTAVSIIDSKISYSDLVYLYKLDEEGTIEDLDKVCTKEEYKSLGEEGQLRLLETYVNRISKYDYIYDGSKSLSELNNGILDYLDTKGNKDNLTLFEYITLVGTDLKLVSYNFELLESEASSKGTDDSSNETISE